MLFFELFPAFFAIVSAVIVTRLIMVDRAARRQARVNPEATTRPADEPPGA